MSLAGHKSFRWSCALNICHPERSLATREAYRQTKSKDPLRAGITDSDARSSLPFTRVLVVSLVLSSAVASFAQSERSFPGKKSELISRDGRWMLQNVDRDQEPYHSILLKDNTSGKSRKVCDYSRSVRVLWAPDSRHFALNDYAGSNFTETTIVSVDETAPTIDVQAAILHSNGGLRESVTLVRSGHDYFGVTRWLDKHRAVVHHWGHSDVPPLRAFCECYVYTLDGSVEKCAHHVKEAEELCDTVTP
jgi:hypothetical protein